MAGGSNTFGGTIKLQGEAEYKKAISSINSSLKVMGSELSKVTAEFGKNDKSVQGLTAKNDVLNKKIDLQKQKIDALKSGLDSATNAEDKNQKSIDNWQISLNKAEAELISMQKELKANNSILSQNETATKNSANSLSGFVSAAIKGITGTQDFGKTLKRDIVDNFNNSALKQGIDNAKNGMNNFKDTLKGVADGSINVGDAIKNKLNKAANDMVKPLKNDKQAMDEFGKSEDDAGKKTLSLGDLIKANLLSDVIKKGITQLTSAMKAIGTTLLNVGKQALKSYADYEQLVGGVETLFKDSSDIVQKYASNAYKTSGLSANKYMETVTSFSASLLQSLEGDTSKAAEVADMAIVDMSDNANKMGTSMESIQNAYQGFAKQNYTMLDNLKLGYGGTKKEMERLLADAEKVTGIKYDISNLNDVYQAIHVIQGELGITGTTAKEANETIQGSVASLKAAWQNMLVGIADDNANFSELMDNLIESILTAMDNILPRVGVILDGLGQLIVGIAETLLPKILEVGVNTITNLVQGMSSNLPKVLESVKTIITNLINGLTKILPEIVKVGTEIIMTLATTLIESLPQIIECGIEVIVALIEGLAKTIPDLIPTIVKAVILMVETLIDHLGDIIDAGIQILFALIDGIIEALPELIDRIPEIIDKVVNAICDNLPKLVEAGITLTVKLAEGLIKAIPKLVAKIPEICRSILNGLSQGLSTIGDIGKNLVQGLWNGIKNAKDWVLSKIKGFGQSILNGIKSFFGIHSPSTVFKDQVGKNLALGLEEGFTDNMADVTKEMQDSLPTEFDTGVNVNPNVTYGSVNSNSTSTQEQAKYSYIREAVQDAMQQFVGVVKLDDEKVGDFVLHTVEEEVYA